MILGPACSEAIELMGVIAERIFNITQVVYAPSSALFSNDRVNYLRFFRLAAMAQQISDAYVALVKELNWKRVAVISYADHFMPDLALHTTQGLQDNHVHVILDFGFSNDDPDLVIEQIKKVHARIIIAWLPPSPVIVLIHFWCMVIRSNLVGPGFVWIFPGWFQPNWWNVSDADCTAEEMKTALEHSLAYGVNSIFTSNLSRIITSQKNVSQFQSDLATIENIYGNVMTDTIVHFGYVYDAMWTIALALNSSISILEDRGLGRLEDFTYDSVEMANVFTEAVANVSFEGISGSIAFQRNGDRINPSIQIRQYRGGVRVPIMTYNPSMGFQNLPGQMLEWQGGPSPPRDTPVPSVTTNGLTETVIAGVVSSIGILSTIIFLTFYLCYSKHPVVKWSSYWLNSLILVAVFVGFVGILLHVIKLDDDMSEIVTTTIYNARVWSNELESLKTVQGFLQQEVIVPKMFVRQIFISDGCSDGSTNTSSINCSSCYIPIDTSCC
ncbi:gamma-aminobutyric acid type B receptor subunit 2-like [Dysidea avara]|uniref:gamma-aminobutyric acid type B receptor subunit 2-like n=1 Tax=Dysidea avara TaxID=196820 RepID=UPI0033308A47